MPNYAVNTLLFEDLQIGQVISCAPIHQIYFDTVWCMNMFDWREPPAAMSNKIQHWYKWSKGRDNRFIKIIIKKVLKKGGSRLAYANSGKTQRVKKKRKKNAVKAKSIVDVFHRFPFNRGC